MSKTSKLPPQDKIDLYDQLIATHPDIERKGVTNPYTSLNGHMFTHLSKDGTLGLRLPKEEREAFLERYNTSLYESHGAIMKEYVAVPDEKLGWVPFARRLGAQIIKWNKIDAIYVTGKPFSSFLIGESLSRRFGIPWIMDLRDLWTLNRRNRPKNRIHAWCNPRLERRLIVSH